MAKEEKAVDSQEVVTEEVVETTKSEESLPETRAEELPLASVDEDETPADEAEQEASEDTESQEESSLKEKEEEIPFNKNPKFQERVKEIEEKYGKKAQLWDTLAKLSNNDPDFQLEVTRRLEAAGELPKGTYELAKKRYETSVTEEKEPDEISKKVESLPEVQFARQLMQQKQQEQLEEAQRIEKILQDFEKRHPDIPQSPNPRVLRARIATLAESYREEGMEYEKSLEEAYNVLFNRESMLASEREKGEIEGQIKADVRSVASTPSESQAKASSTGLRKLTREEEEARAVLNMTREEYIRYKDSDGFVE